jgi:hypothetical protein
MGGAAGRGSMTIGRAVALCLRNIGGQRAGETTKSVFGQPARFGFCIGEWEERSPWPSLAQRRGFGRRRDVVTVHGGKGTFPLADIHNDDARDLLYLIAKSMAYPLANMFLGNVENGEVVVASTRCGPNGSAPRSPTSTTCRPTCRRTRGSRSTCGPRERPDAARARPRRRATAACTSSSGPTRSCPIVCGGLGSLHAIACRASARARCRASPSCGRPDDGRDPRAAAVDEVAGFLRADGADLLLRDANPKTARVHLDARCSTTSAARSASCRPTSCARRSAPALERRIAGEFELVLDDPRRDQ